MARYFTSDLHIGHSRIIEYANRPFVDVDEMNATIIDNINSTVRPEDTLIILGDIVMGTMTRNLPLLGAIRCRRVMLHPGNHDRWSLAYPTKGDAESKRYGWMKRYRDAARAGTEFWVMKDHVPSVWRFKVTDYSVWGSHYPWEGDSHPEDRHPELRPRNRQGFLLCGHVHTAWKTFGRQYNVGVDVHDFKPVHEEEIRAWIDDTMARLPDRDEQVSVGTDLLTPRGSRRSAEETFSNL